MSEKKEWFVGAQNDALFIITRPPAPSNDSPRHDRPECEVIAKVYAEKDAPVLAAAWNMLYALLDIKAALQHQVVSDAALQHASIEHRKIRAAYDTVCAAIDRAKALATEAA